MTPALGKNPFRPGVGIRPVHLAGRDPQMRRFRAMLRAAPEQPANMRLTPELAPALQGKRIRASIWLKTKDITADPENYHHAGFVVNAVTLSQAFGTARRPP